MSFIAYVKHSARQYCENFVARPAADPKVNPLFPGRRTFALLPRRLIPPKPCGCIGGLLAHVLEPCAKDKAPAPLACGSLPPRLHPELEDGHVDGSRRCCDSCCCCCCGWLAKCCPRLSRGLFGLRNAKRAATLWMMLFLPSPMISILNSRVLELATKL